MATPKKKHPKKAGARNKYISNVYPRLLEIAAWSRDGRTDKEMAETLQVSEASFHLYKTKYPEFKETLKVNKDIADIEVENKLYQRALGYEYEEETIEYVNDENGKPKIKSKKVTKKMLAPDTTAQIFWLKNRKMKEWRDKQHLEHSGEIKTTVENLSDAEIDKRLAELMAKNDKK